MKGRKNSFTKIIQYWGTIFLIGFGLLFIIIDIINYGYEFNILLKKTRSDYLNNQKQKIKREVIRVVNMIKHKNGENLDQKTTKTQSQIYLTKTQKDLISDISRIRFGKNGYIFITKFNGDALIYNGKIVSGQKKVWELSSKNPKKIKDIYQRSIRAALKPEGDYLYYSFIKMGKLKKEYRKVSFIYGIPKWKWYVGAGVYLDDIDKSLKIIQSQLKSNLKNKLIFSILLVILLILVFLLLFKRLNIKLKNDLNLISSFFKKAAISNKKINRNLIQFEEIDYMAENANIMVMNRESALAALDESEIRYHTLFDSASDAIFLMKDETFVNCNKKTLELFECNYEDIIGKSPFHFSPPFQPDGSESKRKAIQKIIAVNKGETQYFEWQHKTLNGKLFDVEVSLNQIKLSDKIFTQAIVRDITERKQVMKSLINQSLRYYTLLQNINGMVYRCKNNKEWTMEFISDGCLKITGYRPEDLLDNSKLSFNDLILPEYRVSLWEEWQEKLKNGKTVETEYKIKTASGNIKWVWERGCGILNEDGQLTHLEGFITDITQLKENELELKQYQEELEKLVKERTSELEKAKEKAEIANKTKSDFLANMSHELRTPLNAVIGFSDLLSSLMKDEKQRSYVKSIKVAGKSLLTLINDILDLSKIEAGMLDLKPNIIDIRAIIEEIKQIFKNKIEKKGLTFLIEIDKKIPDALILDEIRIRQILLNLVGNAEKFTEKGYIKIKVEQLLLKKEKIDLSFTIEDSGIGISPNNIDTIFDSFKQHEKLDTKKYGGTGLGLAICKKLTTAMGGEISVNSILNKGSVFNIILKNIPITKKKSSKDDIKTNFDMENIIFEQATILVVDDIQSSLDMMEEILTNIGFKVITAKNGKIALDLLKNKNIKLVFLDIRMPVMDGIETLKKIKEDPNINKIPIIAITASSYKEKKIEETNFTNILSKPFNIKDLTNLLTEFFKYKTKNQNKVLVSTLDKLNFQNIKDPDKFISTLNNDILPLCNSVKEVMIMGQIKKLGEIIASLGVENSLQSFIQYGENITNCAKHFDTLGIKNEIEQIIIEIKKINTKWKEFNGK